MASRPVQEGALVHMDIYRTRNRRQHQPPLVAYCLASGVLGTAAATALSFTVSGTASFAVWVAALVAVCSLAGFGYDSALLGAAWTAFRRSRRP